MTDLRLYLAIGLPTFAVIISMVASVMQSNALGARITSLEASMNARFTSTDATMNARFTSIENRLTSLDSRFDTLVGKVVDVDNRLTRVEAFLERR